jgi:hypothetical protein
MPFASAFSYATQVLTSTGVFTDTQTVVVGGKTYTTQTSLTNVDGNVAIGGSAAITLQNLFDAINLTGTPGTQYAAAMTKNTQVKATAVTATTLTVAAKVPGTVGNLIPATETQTNAAWGAATLAGAVGAVDVAISEFRATNQLNSAAIAELAQIDGPSVGEG